MVYLQGKNLERFGGSYDGAQYKLTLVPTNFPLPFQSDESGYFVKYICNEKIRFKKEDSFIKWHLALKCYRYAT